MSHWRSVAYAESPLQLLNVVEAHAYGILGPNCELVVRDPNGSIAPTLSALKEIGLPIGIKVFGSKDTPQTAKHTTPKGDYVHVLGDPFSGQQQSGLLRRNRVTDVVIVDDGLNTFAAVEALAANRAMVRPGQVVSPARRTLGLAMTHQLRRAAFSGRLTVFTAMPPTEAFHQELAVLDAHVVFHQYPWLSSTPAAMPAGNDTVVVGSGFVADGHIHQDPYVEWVRELARNGPVLYYPHRRTTTPLRRHIAALDGVSVAYASASVEVSLRGLNPPASVHMLPTTALITLAPMLSTRGVPVVGHQVPSHWWTDQTSPGVRDFLTRPLSLFESQP